MVEDGEDARANVVDRGRHREIRAFDARERGAMVGDGRGGGDVGGEEGGAGIVDDAHARAHRAAAVGFRADHLAVERHRGARAGRLGTGSDFKRASAGGVRGRRALRRDGEGNARTRRRRIGPCTADSEAVLVEVLAKGVQVGEVLAAGAAPWIVRGVSRLRAMRDELLGRLEPLVAVPARRLRRPRRVRRRRGRLRVLVLAARAKVERTETAPSAEGRGARHGECAAGRSRLNRETAESWRFARASTFSPETAFSHRPRLVAARRGKWGRKRPAGHNRPRLVMRTLCRFLPRDVAIVLIMVGAFVALGLTLRGLAEAGVVPKADSRRLLESSRPRHLSSANPASRARVARSSSRPSASTPSLASSRPTPRISRHGPPGNPARGRSTSTTRLWAPSPPAGRDTPDWDSARRRPSTSPAAMRTHSRRRRRTRRRHERGERRKPLPPTREAPHRQKSIIRERSEAPQSSKRTGSPREPYLVRDRLVFIDDPRYTPSYSKSRLPRVHAHARTLVPPPPRSTRGHAVDLNSVSIFPASSTISPRRRRLGRRARSLRRRFRRRVRRRFSPRQRSREIIAQRRSSPHHLRERRSGHEEYLCVSLRAHRRHRPRASASAAYSPNVPPSRTRPHGTCSASAGANAGRARRRLWTRRGGFFRSSRTTARHSGSDSRGVRG